MSLAKQMKHRDREMVPRILVQGMFALMLSSLAIVAFAQWRNVPNRGVLIEAPIVQTLDIILTGDRNGLYQVINADGAQIAASSDHKAGFIGVIGRSIERERLVHGITGNPPIQVVRRDNGNIAIVDDTTAMSVELIGYGVDNVAAFARLLD